MEADTAISENLVHGVDGGKDFVNHEELTDTDLSQKLFYEGITKVVGSSYLIFFMIMLVVFFFVIS
jgi:hypothetical protein